MSFRSMYRERRGAMLKALQDHMPEGATWTHPIGGFFVWVTLPEGVDSQAMLPRGVESRVAYVPGAAFYADGQGSRNVRLSYCFPPAKRIVTGVERFADVVRNEMDMLSIFGVKTPSRHPQAPGPSANRCPGRPRPARNPPAPRPRSAA